MFSFPLHIMSTMNPYCLVVSSQEPLEVKFLNASTYAMDFMKVRHKPCNLYYYSSPVRKNLSSKFDVFLAGRSQFDSDHGAYMRIHVANPRSLDRFLHFIVLCFLRKKVINNVAFRQMRCLRWSFRVRCRHRSMPD